MRLWLCILIAVALAIGAFIAGWQLRTSEIDRYADYNAELHNQLGGLAQHSDNMQKQVWVLEGELSWYYNSYPRLQEACDALLAWQ